MTFRELHFAGDLPLLLPDAWDVASALAFAEAGFPAVGTTSFGVAAAAGHADGGRATKDATLALVRALAPLPVHVTADIEDGYAEEVAAAATALGALGVAGVNLEDSTAGRLIAPEAHARKVRAVKRHAPELFVNARVDTYWLGQEAGLTETLRRAAAYVEAGADGVFAPGATGPEELRRLAAEIPVPVNVLVVPGLSLADLGALGIRRVSTGSLPYRAAIDAAVGTATAVRDGGPLPPATPYPRMQQRLLRYEESAR
ncbi:MULTISPECIES: isocitrate lyase/phosphoenolpyruvate mutase family protein [unclassified Streptomyces]|uniref:isocitrate lyase/PEP mutase family protein n=1 Tax=unclassified Streptomyces TaxID=2593676 RepID=UPI00380D8D51